MDSKISTTEKNGKRGRKPGCKKTGGRKKGVPNKKSLIFRERLEAAGCDIEATLTKAILERDFQMIEALSTLLPYLAPKLVDAPTPQQPPALNPALELDTNELLALVKK